MPSFTEVEHWVKDAASSAVAVVESLTALGHLADDSAAQKGFAVQFVEKILHAKLEQCNLLALEGPAFALIDPLIEWALKEAETGAEHLPGGFGALIGSLVKKLE